MSDAKRLREALVEEDERLERDRQKSERQQQGYQRRKKQKPRPLTKRERRAALVPVVRDLAKVASERWAATYPTEALLLVFKSEHDLNTDDVLWCRISAHRFDTLTDSLWFWQKPLPRIRGANHVAYIFRRVSGMRRVVGGVRAIKGVGKELLHRVITNAVNGKVSYLDGDILNATDSNLRHRVGRDYDPAKALLSSRAGRRVFTQVLYLDAAMPFDEGGEKPDDW